MKKLLSLILCLIMIFNTCEKVFAAGGDPLLEHKNYGEMIRKEFSEIKEQYKNDEYPIKYEIKPNFGLSGLFSDDYRTVRVYNIPHLLRYKGDSISDPGNNGFFRTYAKALIDARKNAKELKSLEKEAKEKAIESIVGICKDKEYDKALAKFLGTTDEIAIESFIASLVLSSNSRILGAIVGTSCIAMNAFNYLQPIILPTLAIAPPVAMAITVAHNVANIARIYTTKHQFAEERVANYALLLSKINSALLTNPKGVLNSNLLVTAVDERPFNPLFLWNSALGRRNDGAWGEFVKIGDLDCAPLAKDYDDQFVNEYIEIFRMITNDETGSLDFDLIERVLDGNARLH